MLFELYKANAAKAPKNHQQALPLHKPGQTSPTSAETEPSTIAAIATNGAAADNLNDAASKNLQADEMMMKSADHNGDGSASGPIALNASFHPRIKYSSVNKSLPVVAAAAPVATTSIPIVTAIPTSVLVSTTPQDVDVKPLIHPSTGLVIEPNSAAASVIQPAPSSSASSAVMPQAAAIAAALLRDGYHNFQQQLRAQEILKLNQSSAGGRPLSVAVQPAAGVAAGGGDNSSTHVTPTKLFENFLRQQRAEQQQRQSECADNEDSTSSGTNDGDDEEDERYNGFEDIHLMEGSKTTAANAFTQRGGQLNVFPSSAPTPSDYMSDESQKFMMAAQAQAFRNLEYSMSDYGGNSPGDGEPTYECRHCGKKYRWKSTLRRHENVECGGKEPSHQCPYCPYKSKQRGNLGVHVRKHHSNLPQLASKRRSKYSVKLEGSVVGESAGLGSANGSDDSSSKLMIDCSK